MRRMSERGIRFAQSYRRNQSKKYYERVEAANNLAALGKYADAAKIKIGRLSSSGAEKKCSGTGNC
jgi:hypothetical protein